MVLVEASRSVVYQSVTSTGCEFGPHSSKINIYLHLYFHFLRPGVEAKRSVEFRQRKTSRNRRKGTECLNTRFPLPTLLCAGYIVKLI